MKKAGLLFIIVTFLAQDVLAQGCTVCTQTAAGLGATSAHGLNNGIIYLAAIPLVFMGTVGFIWYKRNKVSPTQE